MLYSRGDLRPYRSRSSIVVHVNLSSECSIIMFKVQLYKNTSAVLPPMAASIKHVNSFHLKRVFEEAVEIIFAFYNVKRKNIGVRAFMEMMDLITPTALIYSSSLWVFHNSSNYPLMYCACTQYGLPCIHTLINKETKYLIDYNVEEHLYFVPKVTGIMRPFGIQIHIAVSEKHIDMLMSFMVYQKHLNAQPIFFSHITIISRYNVVHRVISLPKNTLIVVKSEQIKASKYRYNDAYLLRNELVRLYSYTPKVTAISMGDLPKITLQRAHSYLRLLPCPKYNIEAPGIIAPTSGPITQLDYDMINDICDSLLKQSGDTSISQTVYDFKCKSNRECEQRRANIVNL